MQDFSEQSITAAVVEAFQGTPIHVSKRLWQPLFGICTTSSAKSI